MFGIGEIVHLSLDVECEGISFGKVQWSYFAETIKEDAFPHGNKKLCAHFIYVKNP